MRARGPFMISGPGDGIETSFARLRWATHCNTYVLRVVNALAEGIAVSSRHLETVDHSDDAWQYEVEHEREVLNTLLGSAFVVWQSYLSIMVSAVLDVDAECRRILNRPLSVTQGEGTRRKQILAFGGPLVAGTRYTAAEAIEAFANYFKHRDEWKPDWRDPKDVARDTARVIRAFGASPGGTSNFEQGARGLGIRKPYIDFRVVDAMLGEWVGHLEVQARADILAAAPRYTAI